MQFMVLGKYSNEGLAGFIQNPNDDRRAAISSMMEKAGGKLIDLYLTRGEYDIVAIGEVDSFEDICYHPPNHFEHLVTATQTEQSSPCRRE